MAAADRTTTGVSVTGTGNGFHLSIPADTIPQTLLLYVGAWEAQGQLTASLSDNSAPAFTDSSVDIVASNGDHHVNGTYTLTFQSSQPGQTLNIDYVLATDHGTASGLAGYVSLQSAVLLPAQPTVTLSSPLDGQNFTYPSDVPLAATASQLGAPISTVSFFSDSQKVFDATTSPYSFALGGLTPGDHTLTATATDNSGVSASSAPVVIAEVATGGVLTGSADTPVNVDLSAGTSDWIHWGGTTPDRKAGINPQISDLSTLANGSAHSFDESAAGGVSYSWSSGTPADSQTGTATQMRMTGYKNGFKITVAADTTLRTLKLYTASGFGQSTLRASLSDGSAAPFVSTFSTPASFVEKVYTIQFQAASANQTLTITDQVTRDDGFTYVALESASVADQTVPQIDTVTPVVGNPGDQVTITGTNFGTAQGTSIISLNGLAMNVVSWSDSSITATVPLVQGGPVIVARGLANSNGVAFAVNLPPPPVISFISPNAGVAGTTVSIFGSNFGTAQNNSTITFNGIAVTPSSWSDTMIVVAAPAVHSGPVVVKTASGPSNGVQFTFAPGIRFSLQSIYVTPDETNLEVGGTATLAVSDAAGNAVTDATWSVDLTDVATVTAATDPGKATLQAIQPGEVTITATSSLGTAKAKATIYLPGATPVGAPAWTFYPQTQDGGFVDGVKARRNSADDPYLYFTSFETATANVDALDENGSSKWKVALTPHPGNDSIFPAFFSAGTNDGGLLTMMGECCSDNDDFNTFYRFGPDGKLKWTYTTPTNVTFPSAIGPDGTIYFWSEGDNTNNFDSPLIALDDATGAEKFRYREGLPSSQNATSAEQADTITPDRQPVSATNPWRPCSSYFPQGQFVVPLPVEGGEVFTEPIVGTDGNLYDMEEGVNISYTYTSCFVTQLLDSSGQPTGTYYIDSMDGQMQYSANVGVAKITPDGSVEHILVGSVSWSGEAGFGNAAFGGPPGAINWTFDSGASQLPQAFFTTIAPDGDGGLLFAWGGRSSALNAPQEFQLTRLVDGSPTYTVPVAANVLSAFTGGGLATNDQGTAFFSNLGWNSPTVTAINVDDGTIKWSTNAIRALAATDDGGVIAAGQLGLQSVDASGASVATLQNLFPDSYLDPGLFLVEGDFGSREVVSTSLATVSFDAAISGGFPVNSGNTANQNQPEFKVVKADACSGYDDSLRPTALVVPFTPTAGATRTADEISASQRTVRIHYPHWKNVTLVSGDTTVFTVSPTQLTAKDTDVVITATGRPTPANRYPLKFINGVTNVELGQVLIDVKQKKTFTVSAFQVSELKNTLNPTSVPTQAALQSELNRIFPSQTAVTLSVPNAVSPLSVHYDLNGSKALTDIRTSTDELQKILAVTGLTPLTLIYVHAFDTIFIPGEHPDGLTSTSVSLGDPSHGGPSVVRDPEISQDPGVVFIHNSRQNVSAHELGHYLGAIDLFGDATLGELMHESADAKHPDPCRIRKAQWDQINPPGSTK